MLFDADDGVEDGIAGQFDSVYEACLQIDEAEALQVLSDLQAAGRCSDAQLNGVSETDVAVAPCTDVRDGCDHMVTSGFMSCAVDFISTGPMAGMCDRTCAFCDGDTRACTDLRDGCESTIATGFVSCDADFCAGTCPMAGQCGTCSRRIALLLATCSHFASAGNILNSLFGSQIEPAEFVARCLLTVGGYRRPYSAIWQISRQMLTV